MKGSIRVAIVGCGRISELHALGYRGRQDARIVAVCDSNAGRARSQARAWGVERVFTDYDKLLGDCEIDLVELLVPHHLHAPMAVKACQAGKHVSVQKPMALCVAEADAMIQAARDAGVVLRVFENFCFYPPHVRAKQMVEAGEIGEPQMIRLHVSTGTSDTSWKVPLSAWAWRFDPKRCGGGPLVFDHGYHIFSLARHLMGDVERVSAWIDHSPVAPGFSLDAPATIMVQFKARRRYGVIDFEHTPNARIYSNYYADDDRVEIVGDKGILIVNRCTARTLDLPELMLFRDGKTIPIPVQRVEWQDSFVDCTSHLLDVLENGRQAVLDGPTGKAVLQFALAVQRSAREGHPVRPDEVI